MTTFTINTGTANYDAVNVGDGAADIEVYGAWYGATLYLEVLSLDGTTWLPLESYAGDSVDVLFFSKERQIRWRRSGGDTGGTTALKGAIAP